MTLEELKEELDLQKAITKDLGDSLQDACQRNTNYKDRINKLDKIYEWTDTLSVDLNEILEEE